MNRILNGSEDASASAQNGAATDSHDLSSLYHYPSLGGLFEQPDSPQLEEMRGRFSRSTQTLERVLRQGTKDEAERAARVLRAYETVLGLFDDLQKLQRAGAKQG
ncbi:MAG TPA: hypothetical protein VGO96_13565 [Pyrinomonadaceae bacterium]|jgi:hypothetical protein|nr:hypothetical protein [Pyrinomonadaceae bacterium]